MSSSIAPLFLFSTTLLLTSVTLQLPQVWAFTTPYPKQEPSGYLGSFVEGWRGGRGVVLRSSPMGDFNTACECFEQRHVRPVSKYISWMDPLKNMCSPPPSRQMGFDIDDTNREEEGDCGEGIDKDEVRLPIYPLPAVYLPSSAIQTLHNVQTKNLRMARDLKAGNWNLPPDAVKNENFTGGNCFVATMQAKDTQRISTIGTLMQVIGLHEDYALDGKSLTRIVVKCRAIGIVQIRAIEQAHSRDEYWIGRVKPIGPDLNAVVNEEDNQNKPIRNSILSRIQNDYSVVRSTYASPTNGVANRELPPYAHAALLDNLPPYSLSDFSQPSSFWNIAETWQMLCNTIREARRSDLRCELNEVMVRAACEKGGPLSLPVKKEDLGEEVRMKLRRMEKEAEEDFYSLGMEPCLDFQALLGMCLEDEDGAGGISVHIQRLMFLGDMIGMEKDRLEAKEKLKKIFQTVEDGDIGEDGDDNPGISGSFFQ